MCFNGGDKPEPIRTVEPAQTLSQPAATAPDRDTTDTDKDNGLGSSTSRAARGTRKYKTENDLTVGNASSVQAPTGIKV